MPAAYREAAGHLQAAYEMSERRACRVLGVDRTSVRYRTRCPDDSALRDRLKALAEERRRFGHRHLHILLRREGHMVNRKRIQMLHREERLSPLRPPTASAMPPWRAGALRPRVAPNGERDMTARIWAIAATAALLSSPAPKLVPGQAPLPRFPTPIIDAGNQTPAM